MYTSGVTSLFNYLHSDKYKIVTGEDSNSSHKQQPDIVSFHRNCSVDYMAKVINRIAEFIVHDMWPISTIDESRFQPPLRLVEPSYSIPLCMCTSSVIH